MRWRVADKYDPTARAIAERHYTRQTPGAAQFLRPGRNHVLVAISGDAAWSTWLGFASHAWRGAWENTLFRNEGAGLSSELILEAVASTVHAWGDPPPLGMITMVDIDAVRRKRDPGRCYRRAGFEPVGWTKERRRLVLQLLPERFPSAAPALWSAEPFDLGLSEGGVAVQAAVRPGEAAPSSLSPTRIASSEGVPKRACVVSPALEVIRSSACSQPCLSRPPSACSSTSAPPSAAAASSPCRSPLSAWLTGSVSTGVSSRRAGTAAFRGIRAGLGSGLGTGRSGPAGWGFSAATRRALRRRRSCRSVSLTGRTGTGVTATAVRRTGAVSRRRRAASATRRGDR